ncbi:MAG: chemotaxis protein CheW [Actinomycetota bacterium]|nr:chemotaxis protein CheW [Actinomycetota bacterium]
MAVTGRGGAPSPDARRSLPAGELQRVLRARARALAREAVDDSAADTVDLAIVRVGAERHALELRHLDEVRVVARPTRVPAAPAVWAGMVAVRGTLYPVLDLSRFLGIEGTDRTAAGGPDAVVVLVSVGGLAAGLLVDDLPELVRIPREDLRTLAVSGGGSGTVTRLTPDLSSILDLDAAFADPRIHSDEGNPINGGDA